jgi:two-component system, NtrC family, sensor kinase
VRDLSAFLSPEMERANVATQLELAPIPRVLIDEDQIRQALLNLCRNAREAMPNGGRLRIELSARDGGALLALSDDGTGIPEEEREKIFDLFYTTKQHGTGLGLPLTQQIVAAHGGRLECRPNPSGGTTFCLWLPALEPGPAQLSSIPFESTRAES